MLDVLIFQASHPFNFFCSHISKYLSKIWKRLISQNLPTNLIMQTWSYCQLRLTSKTKICFPSFIFFHLLHINRWSHLHILVKVKSIAIPGETLGTLHSRDDLSLQFIQLSYYTFIQLGYYTSVRICLSDYPPNALGRG